MVSNSVSLEKKDAEEMLSIICSIIFSIDRIGSANGGGSDQSLNQELLEYVSEWNVMKDLAKVRGKLSVLFDDQIEDDNLETELGRLISSVPYRTTDNKSVDDPMTRNKVREIQIEAGKKYLESKE